MIKRIHRWTNDLEVEILPSYQIGREYTCEEIAERLGVEYINSSKPNSKLIKAITKFFGVKPTGAIHSTVLTESNGGYGGHFKEKPLFDDSAIEVVKGVIQYAFRKSIS